MKLKAVTKLFPTGGLLQVLNDTDTFVSREGIECEERKAKVGYLTDRNVRYKKEEE